MDKKAHFVMVGAFMLTTLAVMLVFFLWLIGARQPDNQAVIAVDFTGAVNGLSKGSPVRYLGVDVGNVSDIVLNPDQPNRVRVMVKVLETTPLKKDTQASLKLLGITGLAYIELKGSSKGAPDLTRSAGEEYPVLDASETDLDKVISRAPELLTNLVEITDRAERMLNDENLQAFSSTLHNLAYMTGGVSANADGTPVAGTSDIRDAAANLATLTKRLDMLLAQNQSSISQFSSTGLHEMTGLMKESRDAARELRQLVQRLKENPSQIIYQPSHQGYRP